MTEKITLGLTQEQARQLLMMLQERPSYYSALADVYAVIKMKIEKGPRQDRVDPLSLTSKRSLQYQKAQRRIAAGSIEFSLT
jgi:hypothetical protein